MKDALTDESIEGLDHPITELSGAEGNAYASHREKDGTYPVIAMLSEGVRIINCKDDLQWIVQRWSGGQWRGLSFCRTRAALIRDARRSLDAELPSRALAIMQALPEMHP